MSARGPPWWGLGESTRRSRQALQPPPRLSSEAARSQQLRTRPSGGRPRVRRSQTWAGPAVPRPQGAQVPAEGVGCRGPEVGAGPASEHVASRGHAHSESQRPPLRGACAHPASDQNGEAITACVCVPCSPRSPPNRSPSRGHSLRPHRGLWKVRLPLAVPQSGPTSTSKTLAWGRVGAWRGEPSRRGACSSRRQRRGGKQGSERAGVWPQCEAMGSSGCSGQPVGESGMMRPHGVASWAPSAHAGPGQGGCSDSPNHGLWPWPGALSVWGWGA